MERRDNNYLYPDISEYSQSTERKRKVVGMDEYFDPNKAGKIIRTSPRPTNPVYSEEKPLGWSDAKMPKDKSKAKAKSDPDKHETNRTRNISLIGLLVCFFAIIGLYLGGAFEQEVNRSVIYEGFDWECEIVMEEVETGIFEGTAAPAGARILKTSTKTVAEEVEIIDQICTTRPIEKEIQVPYEVEVDIEMEVPITEDVEEYVGTERIYYDDGTFEDIDKYEPTQRTRYVKEIVTEMQTMYNTEIMIEDVEDCVETPRLEVRYTNVPYYVYELDEWIERTPIVTKGATIKPYYADVMSSKTRREKRRKCTVTFRFRDEDEHFLYTSECAPDLFSAKYPRNQDLGRRFEAVTVRSKVKRINGFTL